MTVIATSNVTLTVVDASTSVPIGGASVYVNTLNVGMTASNGTLLVALPVSQSSTIEAKATMYQDYTSSMMGGATASLLVQMTLAPVEGSLTITLSIPTSGASYIVTGPDGFTDSGTVDTHGNYTSTELYAPGVYSVEWSAGGTPRTDPMTVEAGQSVYSFLPLPGVVDTGSGSAASSSAATAPSTANPAGLQLVSMAGSAASGMTSSISTVKKANQATNVTWPPYNYGKYFTPTQAFMYIGNVYIDELNSFQYTLQGNKVPVFGYSSYMMDAVGTGKSIVQGQLTINFISEGYLYTVLSEYASRSAAQPAADETAALNLTEQYTLLVSSGAGSNADGRAQMATVRQQLNQLLANNSNLPAVISSAQKSARVDKSAVNPVYNRVPFDIVFKFEGGGRTITRRVRNCVLTSNEQILGDNDSVVLEGYGFIARQITES